MSLSLYRQIQRCKCHDLSLIFGIEAELRFHPSLHIQSPFGDDPDEEAAEDGKCNTCHGLDTEYPSVTRRNSQIVNVHPTPIELIKGSTAAVAPAANIYCTTYLPLITSERICGITSVGSIC